MVVESGMDSLSLWERARVRVKKLPLIPAFSLKGEGASVPLMIFIPIKIQGMTATA